MHADPAGIVLASVIAFVLLAVAAAVVVIRMRGQRDELFADLTPGLLPVDPAAAERRRVGPGLEWNGPVAVQFAPPAGGTPGTIGTVIDGVAHQRDVSATILDLAVRGWFRLTQVPTGAAHPDAAEAPGKGGAGPRSSDWELTAAERRPSEPLTEFEAQLLHNLFATGPRVRLSQLRGHFDVTMREAQVGLYRDALARGWYRKHPLARNSWLRKLGIGFLIPLVPAAVIWVAIILLGTKDLTTMPLVPGVLGFFLIFAIWGSTRTPRTAEGTAARIQGLGFRRYIETAEARQIRFEEAESIFSRYLPYAMAFGLASLWAKTFAEVAVLAQNAGYVGLFTDFTWISLVDVGALGVDLAGGVADVAGLAGSFGDLGDGLGAAFEGLSGAVDGAGDFLSGAGDLFDFGGGGGCDVGGCDLPGCDL